MAIDALRLRNIIQLIGILSERCSHTILLSFIKQHLLVFHAALIVMAALQVHQTHTALVVDKNCDATVSFIVSCQYLSDAKTLSLTTIAIEMRWAWHLMEKSRALFDCHALHSGRHMVSSHVLDQRTVCRIWVSYVHSHSSMILKYTQLGYLPRRGPRSEDEEFFHCILYVFIMLIPLLCPSAMCRPWRR